MTNLEIVDAIKRAAGGLLTAHEPALLFLAHGLVMSLGTLAIFLVAYRIMSGKSGDDYIWEFLGVVALIGMVSTMIRYYDSEIPGLGTSFSGILVDGFQSIADMMGARHASDMERILAALAGRFFVPGPWEFLANVVYLILITSIVGSTLMTIAVSMLAMIWLSLCILIGPLFCVSLLIKPLNFMFWGWMKTTLGYALVPVAVSGYVLVGVRFIEAIMQYVPQFVSVDDILVWGLQMSMILIGYMVGLWKIPHFTASLMSGAAYHSHQGLGMARFIR
jgi:TrbL/VirB6 plasmid conjugal transfer protein